MTGPGDGITAGRGHLLAADADRERAVGTLKIAFVQGRLTKDELEVRAGQAFSSRTYADLAAVTADLPTGLTAAPPALTSASAREPDRGGPRMIAILAALVAMTTAFLWAISFLTEDNRVIAVAFMTTLADFAIVPMIAFVIAAQAIDRRQQKRSGGPPPPPPSDCVRNAIIMVATRSA